jgi:hypothetical protein
MKPIEMRIELQPARRVDVGPYSTEPCARCGFEDDHLEIVGYTMPVCMLQLNVLRNESQSERGRGYTSQPCPFMSTQA